MSTLDDLAAKLAEDCLRAMKTTGHDTLHVELGGILAAQSPALEQAFLDEVRLRLADKAGRDFLLRRIRDLRDTPAPASGPETPPESGPETPPASKED